MGKIILEDIEFFAYHGCFKEEKVIGNKFIVNLEIETDTSKSEKTDKLDDTINYQEVYNIINEIMSESCDLLEHLGAKIIDAIMLKFTTIHEIKVKVSKLNPPMGSKMRAVSFETVRSRKKTCPACNKQFVCLHNADCWCMNYKLSKEQLDLLKEKYSDCICEQCMKKLV
jgi:7,8-dihydroneopterin aldolase/epimerase/oxygenase